MPPTSPAVPSVATHSDDSVVSIKVVIRKVASTRHYHAFLLGSTEAGRQKIIGAHTVGLKLMVEAGVLLKESKVAGAGKGWQPFDTGISKDKAAGVWAKMVAKANALKDANIPYDSLDRDTSGSKHSNAMAHDPELTHCNAVLTTVLQATTDQQAVEYIAKWNARRRNTAQDALEAAQSDVDAAVAVVIAAAGGVIAGVASVGAGGVAKDDIPGIGNMLMAKDC